METFSALLDLCEGNPPVTGGFPSQRPVTQSFDVFCDLRRKKTVEQTIETPVIWDSIALILTLLLWNKRSVHENKIIFPYFSIYISYKILRYKFCLFSNENRLEQLFISLHVRMLFF